MIVNRAGQRRHQTPNADVYPLATPATGSRDLSVIQQRMAAGHTNPAHSHDREEVMVITEGSATVIVGEVETTLSPGDTCIIPAGVVHAARVSGTGQASWIIVSTRGVTFVSEHGETMHPDWAE